MNNAQRIENAIKWIDKLRTTRMKQGKGRLGDSKSGYCCLGVGCKVIGIQYSSSSEDAPQLIEFAGLLDEMGETDHFKGYGLAHMNDDLGYSFNQIAKEIIANPEAYFTPAVAKGIRRHYS